MANAHADIAAALLDSRIRQHRNALPATASVSAGVGLLMTSVLWSSAPHGRLLGWLVALALALLARLAVGWLQGPANGQPPARARRWLHGHRAAMLLHGLVWASAMLLLAPMVPAAQRDPLLYALTAMAAGSLIGAAFDLGAALLFAAPVWLALLGFTLLAANSDQRAPGGMVLTLLVLTALSTAHNQRAIRQNIRMKLAQAASDAEARQLQASAEQARQQLADQHRLLTQLLQTTPQGFWIVDEQGVCTEANPAMCALLQLPRTAVVGRTIASFFDGADLLTLQQQMQLLLHGQRSAYEICLQRADGSRLVCLVHATPLVDGAGQPLGSAGIWTDVTAEQRTLQQMRDNHQALTAARDDAERANRAKSQFLSQMSHELRTPLNAISGFGQLLQSDTRSRLQPQQSAYVREILRGAEHLLELINEVLDLGRIETGKLHITTVPVLLLPLLDECLALMRALALVHGVQLHPLQAPPALAGSAPAVLADRTRLKQVLLNLLANAIKYNRPGGNVHVRCSAEDGRLRIAVQDSGRGLDSDEQARLFQPFERLGATGSAIEGTGIGLALSRRLVEAMDGEIGASSDLGVGSTFWLLLHAVPGTLALQDSAGRKDDLPAGVVTATPPPPPARPQHTVLYIEDNAVNVVLMEAMLQRLPQVRLLTAELPEPGLALAQRSLPALVLLDIQLPGMDGFQVLAELRRLPATRHTPVVAVSANALPADISRALAAGFTDYLTKPLQLDRLLDTVQRLLPTAAAGNPTTNTTNT